MLKHNPKLNLEFKKCQTVSKIAGQPIFTKGYLKLLSEEIGWQIKEDWDGYKILWITSKFINTDPPGVYNSGS